MRFRSPLIMICALALSLTACSNGVGGTSLPFNAPPNAGGGNTGTLQGGASGAALLRFVQGSPDVGSVDVCLDDTSPGGSRSTNVSYKSFTVAPITIAAGIAHTVSIFQTPSVGSGGPGAACATAPGPFFGQTAIASTVITPAAQSRFYLVLAGRVGSTLGLYLYPAPGSFASAPATAEAQLFNASPSFGAAGFGFTLANGGGPVNGVGSLNPPSPSSPTASNANAGSSVLVTLPSQPASVFVGAPVTSGAVAPLATTPAPAAFTGNPYVIDVFSVDSKNGAGVDVVALPEPTTGFGF